MAKRKRSRSSRQLRSYRRSTAPLTFTVGRSAAAIPDLRRYLDSCRRRYEQGDREALLEALDAWLECCKGPPAWIADGFYAGWTKWRRYEVRSLGAAFGVRQLTEKRRKKLHAEEALRSYIMLRIEQLRRRNIAIGIDLFDQVGAEINKSGTFVSRVHYAEASAGWRKIARIVRFI
jgi:hypothetical protein